MKKVLFYQVIFIFLFTGCNKKYEKTLLYGSGELKEKYVYNNKSDYLGNKSYDAYFYYKNGNLELVTTIKEGKRENNYIEYYENGNIKRIRQFRHDKKHGLDKKFSIKGELVEEDFYIKNVHMTKMKLFYNNENVIHKYYYVENDTINDIGILTFSNDGDVLENESFYYLIEGKDTISKNGRSNFTVNTFTFGKPNIIDSMLIGEFDENYDFINPENVIRLSSKTNELEYSFKPLKKGNNLLMGKIYISNDSTLDGELLEREFIFYKDYYVKDD